MTSNIKLYTITFPLQINGEETPLELVEYYHNDNEAVVMGNCIAQLINCGQYIVTNEATSETFKYTTIWTTKKEGSADLAAE